MKKNTILKIIISINVMFLCTQFNINCSNKTHKNHTEIKKDSVINIQKPGSSFQDTLTVKNIAAVFFKPDSLQFQKIKGVIKTREFKSMQHDCFYQMRNSRMVLKEQYHAVKILETTSRWIQFIKKDKSEILIDLDKKDFFGLIIFDPKKDPEFVDMTNIETALGFYFTK